MAESDPDRYALVGHPVHHSRSPMIHQLFARQTGEQLTYELIDADADQFETAVLGFRAAGGKGMNVTVPYKQAGYEIAHELGSEAARAKAVNTLTFAGRRIRGDNTDGIGLLRDLTDNLGQAVADRRVLILGAGGATRGILGPLLDARPAALSIANRTVARAAELEAEFAGDLPIGVCGFDELEDAGTFDIVINATSVGLTGEQPPFPASLVGPETFCYDLVYSLDDTPFVTWARTHGAGRAVQGWGMLVEQAAESFAIWRGWRPETGSILEKMAR
jgi:shikimate dehydrogenase